MKISFFGHADFCDYGLKEKTIDILTKTIGTDEVEFLFGGYGKFDSFAYECCKEIKKHNEKIKCTFVSAYLGKYLDDRKEQLLKLYDGIIYPPLENVYKKLAILKRNFWMIDESDFVIFFVERTFGGAYTALKHAKKRGKNIINLCDLK